MQRSPLMADASPTADAVRAQLARILASDLFLRSDRLTAFLTFIVEQTLDGHGAGLKFKLFSVPGSGSWFGVRAGTGRWGSACGRTLNPEP